MILTGLSMFFFGAVSELIGMYNKVWYIGFWLFNGLVQSAGWPSVVAIMGNWFGKSG